MKRPFFLPAALLASGFLTSCGSAPHTAEPGKSLPSGLPDAQPGATGSLPPSSATVAVSRFPVGAYRHSSSGGDGRQDIVLKVKITCSGPGPEYRFLQKAWHPDGHGAAPDAGGEGTVDSNGIFRFTFEDSFENQGSGSIRATPSGAWLSMRMSKVTDPRCLVFYGDFPLQKVEGRGPAAGK